MADEKISDLTEATSVESGDEVEIRRASDNLRLSAGEWARTDGTLADGDVVRVKSVGPLVVEKVPSPSDGDALVWDGTNGEWVADSGTYRKASSLPPVGNYITVPRVTTATFRFADGDARAEPFDVDEQAALDRIAVSITDAGTSGAEVRLGLYDDDGDGSPGALIVDAGTVDGTTAGDKAITISETVGPGRIWMVAVNQGGASTTPQLRYVSASAFPKAGSLSKVVGSDDQIAVVKTGLTGALPDPWGSTSRGNNPPLVAVRLA